MQTCTRTQSHIMAFIIVGNGSAILIKSDISVRRAIRMLLLFFFFDQRANFSFLCPTTSTPAPRLRQCTCGSKPASCLRRFALDRSTSLHARTLLLRKVELCSLRSGTREYTHACTPACYPIITHYYSMHTLASSSWRLHTFAQCALVASLRHTRCKYLYYTIHALRFCAETLLQYANFCSNIVDRGRLTLRDPRPNTTRMYRLCTRTNTNTTLSVAVAMSLVVFVAMRGGADDDMESLLRDVAAWDYHHKRTAYINSTRTRSLGCVWTVFQNAIIHAVRAVCVGSRATCCVAIWRSALTYA